jgi:hypothetical protein
MTTTFNAETAELAEHNRFLCGFRELCGDRRGWVRLKKKRPTLARGPQRRMDERLVLAVSKD